MMKKLLVAWVLGFVFAMSLVVRWQRIGDASVASENAAPAPGPTEDSQAPVAKKPAGVGRLASAGWESIRVGAQEDLGRLQKLFKRARPESDPVPEPTVDTLDLTTKDVSASGE